MGYALKNSLPCERTKSTAKQEWGKKTRKFRSLSVGVTLKTYHTTILFMLIWYSGLNCINLEVGARGRMGQSLPFPDARWPIKMWGFNSSNCLRTDRRSP